MKRLLSAHLRVWHLALVVALTATSTVGLVLAHADEPAGPTPRAGVPLDFWKKGAFRIVASSRNGAITVAASPTESNMVNANFTVPAGKKADIVVVFGADASISAAGFCYGRLRLDSMSGTQLDPAGVRYLANGNVATDQYLHTGMQGSMKGIGQGDHTVFATGTRTAGSCSVATRSLILIANIHD